MTSNGNQVPENSRTQQRPETNVSSFSSSSSSLPVAERLRGRENYNSWALAMKWLLIREGTWKTVEVADNQQVDENLSLRALATICLGIAPVNYSLVQDAKTAQEAWTSLKNAFQDSGMTRRMGLLRKLTSVRLEQCNSVEDYVNEIMCTKHQLDQVNFKVDDTWLASILLMGLPENYEPMIMGLEASGAKMTADAIKAKILQDVKKESAPKSAGSEGAFVSNQRKPARSKSELKCFKCKRKGHFASDCQQEVPGENSKSTRKQTARSSALSVGVKSPGRVEPWIFDSGATKHMCCNLEDMKDGKRIVDKINVANSAEVPVVATGSVELEADVGGTCSNVTLTNAICVPDLAINLMSVSEICQKGHRMTFTKDVCKIYEAGTNEVLAVGEQADGLYRLKQVNRPIVCAASAADELKLWHRRLGHMNVQNMKILPKMATGVAIKDGELLPCVPCIEGKHQRLPFNSKGTRAKDVLELIHTDLCGPMEQSSIAGSLYFVTFIDDASRMTSAYYLRSKKEVQAAFEEYKAFVETQTGKKIKRLRSDNGKEYVNQEFQNFLKAHGIKHELTVPYNPEQNGMAERMNRTIEERARAMLFDAGLGKRFWAEAVCTAVYLINRSPTKGLSCTPVEQFTGRRPDLSHLRVFGAKVMAHVPKAKRRKWDRKSEPHVLVGYAFDAKGYRLYNQRTDKVITSRDIVVLSEQSKGACQQDGVEQEADRVEFSTRTQTIEATVQQPIPVDDDQDDDSDTEHDDDTEQDDTFVEALDETLEPEDASGPDAATPRGPEGPAPSALPPQPNNTPPRSVRRSERERRFQGKYNEVKVTHSIFPQKILSRQDGSGDKNGERISTALPSRSQESVGKQQDSESSDWERPIKGKCNVPQTFGANSLQSFPLQTVEEPSTFREAIEHDDSELWIEAMDAEYQALMDNETWALTKLPPGRKALKNKWVYKTKVKSDGSIERHKARLVIKGCSQIEGVDYKETYSPVVRYATIRYLLAKAAELDLDIYQIDAVTAFLQGDLGEEDIYMQQPEGFDDGTERVCRLKKALYGLKQASRVWNLKLDAELRRIGLKRSKYDTCVYHRVEGRKLVIVTIYVDDFLIFSNDDEMVREVKRELTKKFRMKDLGKAEQVLGIRISRGNGTVAIDQERYINELLEKFQMTECNPVHTPVDLSQKLSREMCPKTEAEQERMKQVPFRELVGSLQFLAQCTRPDICHAVNLVSSFCSNPGEAHWTAAKRILRYLRGTKQLKMVYSKQKTAQFEGFTDSDWGNDADTRRSVSGYVFLKNGGAITWSSRRQPTVALSTSEAEYMALSATTQEAMWWRGFIGELTGRTAPMKINCDNKSAISLAEKEMGYSPRSKHIDIRHHFVREQVELKSIKLQHVASEQQAADVLTKAVPGPKFNEARRNLGVHKF